MLRLFTLPFRWVRATRYALIASGALISGLGLWMQINGVPPAGEPVISGLRDLMALVMDGPTTVFGVFSKIGGVMALLGLLGMTVQDIAPAGRRVTRADPAPDIQSALMVSDPAASTWQERLAAKTGPQPREPAVKSTRSSLRFAVVGLVICAFLTVLVAALLGAAPGQAPAGADSAGPGHAMIRAHLAAAGAISDEGPVFGLAEFAVSKFDPAVIVPWVKAQLALALGGDQAAMITLGSLFGGIFVLMLGIKIVFGLRRSKTLGRQVSLRQIGYN